MKEVSVTLKIHLQPRASRNGIDGVHGDALKVKVTSPPLEGRANKAVKKLLAEQLGLSPSQVEIIAGQRSREKLVRVSGLSRTEVERALGTHLPAP
ncbi:MAG: YggU family protein [Deltaproteobacteria bacterium]|nr:YggU family protein [Deltaproteobacteria bacterium]